MINKKIMALAAVGCIGAGTVILVLGCAMGGRPGFYIDNGGVHAAGSMENRKTYVQEKIKIDEFSSVSIDLEYADLEVIPSDGYYLEYRIEGGSRSPQWNVKNQKLTFNEIERHGFGSFMVWGDMDELENYNVKLYIPKDKKFTNVRINSGDGDVMLPDIKAATLSTRCDYGDLSIESFTGGRWDAGLDDGSLKAGFAEAQKMVIDNEYGDCILKEIKGDTVKITMDDGDLEIGSMGAKDLQVENEYGHVDITTVDSWEKYDMDLLTEYGRIELPDGRSYYDRNDDEEKFRVNNGNDKKISVNCDDGDIQIKSGKK